jgi:SAM-dependent MidA family methyltransferase
MGEWIWQKTGSIEARSSGISFAEFMDHALYHPIHGYYVTQAQNIGAKGDFYTSPHLSSAFGDCIARQVLDCWDILGQPDRFEIVEMGAGQGLLAADILNAIARRAPDCFKILQYRIIERSATLQLAQRQHLNSRLVQYLETRADLVTWCDWKDLGSNSVQGCFISNELVDAFPVHQVIWKDQQLQEVYVQPENDQIVEVFSTLSTPKLQDYFDRLHLNFEKYPEGYRTEVNLNAIDWIQTVADRLHRGYVLTIDYGYSAERYYSPMRREGTLQCYYQHQVVPNPYINIGLQDITAHVDFTTLEICGSEVGLKPVGLTTQAFFLMLLGLGDRIAALSQTETQNIQEINDRLQTREALHRLINPMGLGNFQVLMQSKNLTDLEEKRSLQGFTLPTRSNP